MSRDSLGGLRSFSRHRQITDGSSRRRQTAKGLVGVAAITPPRLFDEWCAHRAVTSEAPAPPDPRDGRLAAAPHATAGDASDEPRRSNRCPMSNCGHGADWNELGECAGRKVRLGVEKATIVSVHEAAVAGTRVRAGPVQ